MQYYWDETLLDANGATVDLPADNNSNSALFTFKQKVTGKTVAGGTKDVVEIMVPLKCFSNFWINLEMSSINCEINLLVWQIYIP